MSRVDKKLRRKHRKEKKHHERLPREWGPAIDLPREIRLLSYDITFERLRFPGERPAGLDEALHGIDEQLHDDTCHNPPAAISTLEKLLERFPNAPMLLNWLATAHNVAGDGEAFKRLTLQNFEHNPNYLFARLNYVMLLMDEDDFDGVEKVLDGKFDLGLMYPNRRLFHISEYRAMCGVAIKYYLHQGEFELAQAMFQSLEELEPDGEVTKTLRGAVEGSFLLRAARKLADMTLRRGRVPTW